MGNKLISRVSESSRGEHMHYLLGGGGAQTRIQKMSSKDPNAHKTSELGEQLQLFELKFSPPDNKILEAISGVVVRVDTLARY